MGLLLTLGPVNTIGMIESLKKLRQYLLTGVSYAIPFIACGGIMIACGIAFVPMTPEGPDFSNAPILKLILDVGSASFALLLPALAGYVAYAIAGKPALVPGFVGGYLSGEVSLPPRTPSLGPDSAKS